MTERDTLLPSDLRGAHIHLVGIKGTGMAALAEILSRQGAVLTGSDVSDVFYTDAILARLGIQALPFSEGNITPGVQVVIHSSAYSAQSNPDLAAAQRLGLPVLLYSEALGALSARAYGIGVCGVHGKTTTTGLAGTLLKALDIPSQALAGSVIASFGGTCTMTSASFDAAQKHYFLAETCEYQRHFLAFHPRKIILTSVESDHQDYYPTYADIRRAFVEYVTLLPQNGELFFCADDGGAVEVAGLARQVRPDLRVVPYGENALGDYKITFLGIQDGVQRFSLARLGTFALRVPGRHNVRNAAAAVALCASLLTRQGKDPADYADAMRQGLLSFTGGRRRSEVTGSARTAGGTSVVFMDDYAHHPTAIRTTLEGYRAFYPGRRIIVDFMSHTYSRTAALLDEFADSFASADCVVINKIYASAREKQGKIKVTGELLAERAALHHANVCYKAEFDQASQHILSVLGQPLGAQYPDGYLVVTMGAGDNWKVGDMVRSALGGPAHAE